MPEQQMKWELSYWDAEAQERRVYGRASDASGAAALRASLVVQPIDARHIALRDLTNRQIVECRSCRAPMVWLKTKTGKNCPVDIEGWEPQDTEYQPGKHISHFATCPHADHHRRPR